MRHRRLSASGSPQWIRCHGSIAYVEFLKKEKKIPEETTNPESQRGTAVHAINDYCITKGVHPQSLSKKLITKIISKNVVLNEQDIKGSAVCYQHVLNHEGRYDEVLIEQNYDLSFIYDTDIGGTADISGFEKRGMMLIEDYKNGRVVVEPASYQLGIYLLGAYHHENEWYKFKKARATIIQPNAPHPLGRIRSEDYSIDDLKRFEEKLVVPACEAIKRGTATLTPGPIQCEWCDARNHCDANDAQVAQLIHLDFENVSQPSPEFPLPNSLSSEQLSYIIDNEKRVISFFKKCREYACKSLANHKPVGNYALEDTLSNRKYIEEKKVKKILRENNLTVRECLAPSEARLRSITQLEQYLSSKTSWPQNRVSALMRKITTREVTGQKLSRSSAPIQTAENDFRHISKVVKRLNRRKPHGTS